MKTECSTKLSKTNDDRLSFVELDKLENRATAILLQSQKMAQYLLVKPEDILAMVEEIKELRLLAHPDALTAAYMAGTEDARKKH